MKPPAEQQPEYITVERLLWRPQHPLYSSGYWQREDIANNSMAAASPNHAGKTKELDPTRTSTYAADVAMYLKDQ